MSWVEELDRHRQTVVRRSPRDWLIQSSLSWLLDRCGLTNRRRIVYLDAKMQSCSRGTFHDHCYDVHAIKATGKQQRARLVIFVDQAAGIVAKAVPDGALVNDHRLTATRCPEMASRALHSSVVFY
jgi:hypothetical protein